MSSPYGEINTKELVKQIQQQEEQRKQYFTQVLLYFWINPAEYVRYFSTPAIVRNTYIWKTNIERRARDAKKLQ